MIRHRYEAWNAALIPGSRQAKAKAAAAAAAARARARAQAAAPTAGPPLPPTRSAIDALFPDYPDRTESQWDSLINPRVKPFEDAANKINTRALAQSEFQFERAEAANKGLSTAFVSMLTGGKTGDEASKFAEENFGGQYLPAQAMQMGHDALLKLTADWNDRDWEIASEYQKAMAEIPGVREKIRDSIDAEDQDEYTRKFNMANLYLDELWNAYEANAKQYNTDQQLLAAKKMAAQQAGLTGWPDRKDALNEATKYTDDTGTIYKVRRAKDGSWEAYPTKQKKPGGGTTAATEIKWKNAALREASDLTKSGTTVWRAEKVNGVWTAVNTGRKKATTGKGAAAKPGSAKEAEAALIKELYGDKEKYTGTRKPNKSRKRGAPAFVQEGGMTYAEAYRQFFDYALSVLSPYGRTNTYVSNWVRQRLANLYPGESPARDVKPGGG